MGVVDEQNCQMKAAESDFLGIHVAAVQAKAKARAVVAVVHKFQHSFQIERDKVKFAGSFDKRLEFLPIRHYANMHLDFDKFDGLLSGK